MLYSKKINKYVPEILALTLYVVCMTIIMYFHEPWFDEAQAWLIARDASIKEILFVLPHYEGHPPIWHLVLLPFAKLGAPYELSIKAVSLTFCSISMGLFMFKSPFKRIIRLTIPFTYFFFYQYGVISRPYCILMLGFILCAMFYKTKESKPVRFVMALGIICSASAYGIILAGGISIVWLIEIFNKSFTMNSIKKILRDERFWCLTVLLIYNLMLIVSIIPRTDTYAINSNIKDNNYINRFIYMFFVLPGDATYLDICNYFSQNLEFNINSLLGFVGSGIISIVLIILTKKNDKVLLLLVPYSFIGVFSTFVYFSPHHIGIVTLFFLFIIWCCYDGQKDKKINYRLLNRLIRKDSDLYLLNKFSEVLFAIVICVSMLWSIGSSLMDIYIPYGEGRELASFIKENNLDKYKIMGSWLGYTNNKTKEIVVDTNLINDIDILPYFNKNIFYNNNNNFPNKCFLTHKLENNDEKIEEWKEFGLPDVIVGDVKLGSVFGDSLSYYKDYVCVYNVEKTNIWKIQVREYYTSVYVRKDILNELPNLKGVGH